jgi:hypothetical protein
LGTYKKNERRYEQESSEFGVPLLRHVLRSDQMQVQEFAGAIQNHFRAGSLSASH